MKFSLGTLDRPQPSSPHAPLLGTVYVAERFVF